MTIKFETAKAEKGSWGVGMLIGYFDAEEAFIIQFNVFKWMLTIKIMIEESE